MGTDATFMLEASEIIASKTAVAKNNSTIADDCHRGLPNSIVKFKKTLAATHGTENVSTNINCCCHSSIEHAGLI